MAQERKIEDVLASYQAYITYVPLRAEVPFLDYVSLPTPATYQIQPRASLDPAQELAAAKSMVGNNPTAIFIPGRAFDSSGTRHGQGGGWYDRFLADAPKEWLRIGFCYQKQFSELPLVRESWDQPMDVVCVVGDNSFSVHETGARAI